MRQVSIAAGVTDKSTFEAEGRIWFRGLLSDRELAAFDAVSANNGRPGARVTDQASLYTTSCGNRPLTAALKGLCGNAIPVRYIFFNKTGAINWGVPWHQDRVIAVREKRNVQGFTNWSRKSGIWHCEPPHALLDHMLFVRIHLDDNSSDNGAMEIALGSHAFGAVRAQDAERLALTCRKEICTAARGDVLVLKMLTLHRSLPSTTELPRRVFRVDFSAAPLPEPLDWAC